MYTTFNYPSKAALRRDVVRYNELDTGARVPIEVLQEHASLQTRLTVFAPGLGAPKQNGTEFVEGPHYPQAHKWYARVEIKDGVVVKVQ